jgi:hypothetical protein
MSPAAILAILSFIIQTTPEALALFNQVKSMVDAKRDPTQEEWIAIMKQMSDAHKALQAS